MSQIFGKTWWGQQWLQSLNNIDYSNRLPRGHSYARKGAVLKVDIKENRIQSKVAGSRIKPYLVDIVIPPFFDPELRRFIDELSLHPVIISRLLNRELDPQLLTIAERKGLKVFPQQWTDFKMHCSCPDWAVPCKHLAAVIYKISAEIDNNPFLVFQLHNVDLIAELSKRNIHIAKNNIEVPELSNLYFHKRGAKKAPQVPFNTEQAYGKLNYRSLSPIHDPLVAMLADRPVFYPGSGDFKNMYTLALGKTVRQAQRLLQGKVSWEQALNSKAQTGALITAHSRIKAVVGADHHLSFLIDQHHTSVEQFVEAAVHIPASRTVDYQPSTAFLHTAFHLAWHLLANGAVIPQIVMRADKTYAIRWLPAMLSKQVRALVQELEEMMPPEIFVCETSGRLRYVDKNPATHLLSQLLCEIIARLQRPSDDLFINMFFGKKAHTFKGPGEEALCDGIFAWIQKYFITQGAYKPQILIEEANDSAFSLSINIQETDKPFTSPIPLADILTMDKYARDRYAVLQSLILLDGFIPRLSELISLKGGAGTTLSLEEFTPFLLQMVPAIELLDIDVLLPKALRQLIKPKVSLKLKRKTDKSFLRLDNLLDFDWQVAIGDKLMDENEFERLLQTSEGLIKYKSSYIYVNSEDLQRINRHFQQNKAPSPFQLLQAALSGEYDGARVGLTEEVKNMMAELTNLAETPLPKGIKAHLRPYQQRGYSWMYRNAKLGFGSVLADDMGLGKTLQVITTLLKYKEEGHLKKKKALIVAPTGLLTNWHSEIEKFAPSLKIQLYHGAGRQIETGYDILLTSYGIARRDAPFLKKMPWHTLVIDEAQNIKNQETAQSKAIKTIKAENFIAMSGTPVENRLSELWSILDFSNRGMLGSHKEFDTGFASPIEKYNDAGVATKLKKLTAPFLMRRLKTDKNIISDLPDKIEMDSFSILVKEQASLYKKTLETALADIEMIDSTNKKALFVRQGLVLQMIMALKQICNHPTQFLKNSVLDPSLSGKMELLFDKLDSIMEAGEKVLVFTQFKEMGSMLQHFIAERYKSRPLFYHGGCSLQQRKQMVEQFQTNHADKIFILSLKAAGTGLNLTAATHVIHYDLWWNPAVEAQATDRAYRIGQKSNVMVHRFITRNSFEERINEMIQSKKALAEMTVSTGENWIGSLSNKELKEIFTLG